MNLQDYAKKQGVKYFMISFTDLFGVQRAKLVPAQVIGEMEEEGAGFAGFASWLDMTPAHPDMLAIPDANSVIQLPWKKEVAWLAGDCVMDGNIVKQAPRNVLQTAIKRAANNVRENIFIGMSSGYDSGAIACELNNQNIK